MRKCEKLTVTCGHVLPRNRTSIYAPKPNYMLTRPKNAVKHRKARETIRSPTKAFAKSDLPVKVFRVGANVQPAIKPRARTCVQKRTGNLPTFLMTITAKIPPHPNDSTVKIIENSA